MKSHHRYVRLALPFAGAILILGSLACEKKLSPEAIQAQEVAKSADSRVAALEKELADMKAAKTEGGDAAHVTQGHQKAIEKQLAEAKRAAEMKRKAAQQLAAQPAPAEAPKTVLVDVPAGSKLQVKLAKDLATDSVQAGDAWEGTLAEDVVVGNKTVWPAGTVVRGVVSQSTPAGRLSSGNGGLGIKLTAVGANDVDAGVYLVAGTARGERNAKYIAGGAALGALVGILSDKNNRNDHALGGAAIGAAAGTAAAAASADTVIRIGAAQPVTFTLSAPEKVSVKP
ncbi:MAG: hypothetical protein LWX11_03860 [Firmicutes bacterium]|nr:hypothetical protein [Bacillota bacterium]